MPTCPSCGGSNSDEAKFCQHCGTSLTAAAPADQRKIVTVLFVDVTDYTPLAEQLDPETLRGVMARFFETVRTVIEQHGGTVAKYIGDAVMAVFGIPQVHEDDALRAVRAADQIGAALADLNVELSGERGITLATRTGVNTGEVMAGDPSSSETFVVGDTVNVAARLEQAAGPGEVILGADTYTLVRDAVEAEALPPLELKGKAERVVAHRLVSMDQALPGRERHLDTSMVGRSRQLRSLRDALDTAVTSNASYLFTLLGSPGVGKTRLVTEFLRGVPADTVHRGRCLSYGEGITYWPVGEIVRSIAGVPDLASPAEVLAALSRSLEDAEEADAIVSRLGGLLELTSEPVAREDGFWAVRRFVEHAASGGPKVLLFDDIQWAEPMLLDLIEHLSDWVHRAPLLLLCAARPELIDTRPGWGGGKSNAASTLLEPLTAEESNELIDNLVGGRLPDDVRDKITAGAEGNPLFVEEMLGMLIDDGRLTDRNGEWVAAAGLTDMTVPASIQTLISARIDRLEREERTLVERGAVEGSLFHVGSVSALAPEVDGVGQRLMGLVRKDFLRPDRAEFTGDDAFRFRHLLIRDTAYESLPKRTRAELHEQFAEWLATKAAETAGGLDAIVAHHYDEAHRYLVELDGQSEHAGQLGALAGARYHLAGLASLSHGDPDAAAGLLTNAVELLPAGREAIDARLGLGNALVSAGRFDDAVRELNETQRLAIGAGATLVGLHAETALLEVSDAVETETPDGVMVARTADLAARLEESGDPSGAARAQLVTVNLLPREEALTLARRIHETARRHSDQTLETEAQRWVIILSFWDMTPLSRVVDDVEDFLSAPIRNRLTEATAWSFLGGALGFLGRFDEGREAIQRSDRLTESLGGDLPLSTSFTGGLLEMYAGDLAAAEARFRRGYEDFHRLGEKNRFSSLAALVGFAAARRGALDEASEMMSIALDAATPGDVDTRSMVAATRAVLALETGDVASAVEHAVRSVELIAPRGGWSPAFELEVLGEVYAAAGDVELARGAYEDTLEIFEAKENLAGAARIRSALEVLES